MKGTLFSADFITDSNDNLRLLEINTDSGFVSASFSNYDFTELATALSTNSITRVHVLHKSIQTEFVEFLSQSLNQVAPFITEFNTTYEEVDSIYPTTITDEADKFILRLCYDESALLDSVYAKNNVELFKLFIDNNSENSLVEFYYQSDNFSHNSLDPANIFNADNLPDVVVKDTLTSIYFPLKFFKAGNSSSAPETRLSALIAEVTSSYPAAFIQKFYDTGTTHVSSIRAVNIVYGSNLDLINLASYETDAILSKPTSLDYSDEVAANQLNVKHYFEFVTNDTKLERGGVFEGQSITDASGSAVLISDIVIGQEFKSYIISGSPDSDDIDVLAKWSFAGSAIPSGSYETTSNLVNKTEYTLKFNLVSHITLSSGAEFRLAPAELILVYNISEDKIQYEIASEVTPANHKLFDNDGNLVDIIESEIEVHDGIHKTYELDLETADTFFINTGIEGATGWVKVLTHNCFVEGTQIHTSTGYKNVEAFKPGDEITTYDVVSKKITSGNVNKIHSAKVSSIVELVFDNKTALKTTKQHPYYVEGKGWTLAKDLIKNDVCLDRDGNYIKVIEIKVAKGEYEVFNLHNVIPNHTFFANDVLVHNKLCFVEGTEITLGNGDVKAIENIVEGDVVLTYNEKTKEIESNRVLELFSPVHDDLVEIKLSSGVSLTSTFDHPYYSQEGTLVSYKPTLTESKYGLGCTIGNLQVGSLLIDENLNLVEVVGISELDRKPVQTYVFKVENNHNFFANGILVHNKL